MAILRYQPFTNELDELPTGLRLFQDSVNRLLNDVTTGRPWTPAVDIKETENELVLTADLPGIDQKDLDIRMENGTLTLKGERKFENKEEKCGYHRIERGYGSFSRSFSLPETVDPEKIRAEYRNGVLSVTLPKKEVAKPRAIKVEVAG